MSVMVRMSIMKSVRSVLVRAGGITANFTTDMQYEPQVECD